MPTNKLLIGIVGENASGKTTMTNYICDTYGAVSFRFSDMLSDMLKRMYLPPTREHLQKLSTAVRTNFGEDIMSTTLARDMLSSDAAITITEGIRRPSDIVALKELPGFVLVAISAEAEKRFKRLHGRNEKPDDATKTWEEFLAEANHEAEQKVKEIMASAHYTIHNTGTKAELFAQIDTLIKSIRENAN